MYRWALISLREGVLVGRLISAGAGFAYHAERHKKKQVVEKTEEMLDAEAAMVAEQALGDALRSTESE